MAGGWISLRARIAACMLPTLIWCLLLASSGVDPAVAAEETPREPVAVVLHLDGAIGPATADYLARGLGRARARGAAIVVLRMDTPGGLDTSMRDIIREILGSPVPVATYVAPSGARAASAGTYILYASHVAAMAPGTNLGAATPVAIGGGLPQRDRDGDRPERDPNGGDGADAGEETAGGERGRGRVPENAMEAKAVNDAVAYIRALADLRGRNADWAEQAVRYAASLSAREAERRDVIDFIAPTIEDVLTRADGRTVTVNGADVTLRTRDLPIEHMEPDWRNRFLAAITNPNIALILMIVGVYGLIFEFMNPGALVPGIVGAICLLVGLYGLAALPVNYAGLALMVLGLALMVAEAFSPSFGILGIGGAVAFVLGSMILIDTEVPEFELSLPLVAGLATVSLALILIILRLAVRAHRRKVVSGREAMVGSRAIVQDWSDGEGHVFAHSERWRAVSDAPLAAGDRVRILAVEGLTLKVAPDTDRHPS